MGARTRTYPNLAQVQDRDTQRTLRLVYDLIRDAEETIGLQTESLLNLANRITAVEPRVSSLESPQTFATGAGLAPQFVVRGIASDLVLTSGSIPRFKKIGDLLPAATRIRLSHSVAQSISTATTTVLTWDTEVYDPKLLHDTVAPTLITIATLGTYVGGVYVGWDANNVNSRFLEIQKNSTDALVRDRRVGTGAAEMHLVLPDTQLVVGDTLRVRAFQDSGGPLDIKVANGSPVFWLRKIA
ncbi:hypothetical protein LCGC14_1731000 [marine sediment metagenome]|uniref:C1q domain-containing protein n=1 Tax=marine sediment metagenome TaxID=412755 RepID=A0A0F9H9C7_9ZZZZ